jgi:hypothetical protein
MEYGDKATGRRSTARGSNQRENPGRESSIDATQGAGNWTIVPHGGEVVTETEVLNNSIGSTEGGGCSAEHYGVNRVRREIIRRALSHSN